jgi:antitoxin component YwqK of YwqJK toxin-antitoxin module
MSSTQFLWAALLALFLTACGGKPAVTAKAKATDSTATAPHKDTAQVRDGHVQYRTANGHVTMEGNLVNGQREGEWTSYTADGRVKSRSNYKAGKPEGLSTVFHPNGEVYYTGWQHDGKQTGLWRFYDEHGKLVRTVNYGDGGQLSTPPDAPAGGR